jgi:hypothetical protein
MEKRLNQQVASGEIRRDVRELIIGGSFDEEVAFLFPDSMRVRFTVSVAGDGPG